MVTPTGTTVAAYSQLTDAAILAAASAALGWILLPFFSAILWGFIIALLFEPWYVWLLPRMRQRRTAAALVTLVVVVVMVVLPVALVALSLAHEASMVVTRVRRAVRGFMAMGQKVTGGGICN